MTRAQRLAELLDRLVSSGELVVEDTADHFGVSTATIRRDLDHLASQQLLTRTHGGAVPNSTSYDLPMRYKSSSRTNAKIRIARAAVEMLWPGCAVSLNGGTTTLEIARALPAAAALSTGITLVTNALNIATELTVRPHIKIMVCGGVARPQSYELVGPIAAQTLGQLTVDVCFLGAYGLDLAAGITTSDEGESAINRVLVQQAKRTVAVLDSAKLGQVGFSRICHVGEVDALITDSDADPNVLAELERQQVEVVIA